MKIYLITNLLNGKQYVGKTNSPLNIRFNNHCSPGSQSHVGKAIKEFGRENFTIELIEEFEGKEDKGRERYWIKQLGTEYPSGYNKHREIPIGKIEREHNMGLFGSILEKEFIELLNKKAAEMGITSKRLGRKILTDYLLKENLIEPANDPFDV